MCVFFFFQAEDGIRDRLVTGVQTCALPIWDYFATLLYPLGNKAFKESDFSENSRELIATVKRLEAKAAPPPTPAPEAP